MSWHTDMSSARALRGRVCWRVSNGLGGHRRSCRGRSQEHVRVAWMSGGVPRWQGACARCVGFRQPRVGGRCYRKPPPTAVCRTDGCGWSGRGSGQAVEKQHDKCSRNRGACAEMGLASCHQNRFTWHANLSSVRSEGVGWAIRNLNFGVRGWELELARS